MYGQSQVFLEWVVTVISCQGLTGVIESLSYTPSLFHPTQRTDLDFDLI
jgi:hypothetical protein